MASAVQSKSVRAGIAGLTLLAGLLMAAPLSLADQLDKDIRPALPGGKVRTYYVAAEDTDWNFAPAGRDEMMGTPFTDEQKEYVERKEGRIGSTYKLARFFEYTDDTFATRKPVAEAWSHTGILGPILRAEVGDVIVVHFKNKGSHPFSMHPHGVFYEKDDEGSMTNDGTTGADMHDDHVPPGETETYVWQVPERAGPGPNDPSSVVWLYHSHVDEVRDTNSGLIGAIIVARKGMADESGKPRDVDREFVVLWKIFNENNSLYLDDNLAALPGGDKVDRENEDFHESNLKHAINGYIFGSQPMFTMKVGERVRWYMMGLGTEPDLHTPHWHGNTVLLRGQRLDVVSLMPAQTLVADMKPDNPGIWMFHCHVDDHVSAGMTARYEVLPKKTKVAQQ